MPTTAERLATAWEQHDALVATPVEQYGVNGVEVRRRKLEEIRETIKFLKEELAEETRAASGRSNIARTYVRTGRP